VSNAIKFTEIGKVSIHLKIDEIHDNEIGDIKKMLVCSVKDTGLGISDANKQKLFKLFGFISETEEKNTNGIGLGLLISEKIVTEFGGKIELDSEVGHGAKFTFSIVLN
jgi:signal transduction histidine kinase